MAWFPPWLFFSTVNTLICKKFWQTEMLYFAVFLHPLSQRPKIPRFLKYFPFLDIHTQLTSQLLSHFLFQGLNEQFSICWRAISLGEERSIQNRNVWYWLSVRMLIVRTYWKLASSLTFHDIPTKNLPTLPAVFQILGSQWRTVNKSMLGFYHFKEISV